MRPMSIQTALKHLRFLHEAEVETGNMKEARAIEVAVAHLTNARAKEIIARAVAKTKKSIKDGH